MRAETKPEAAHAVAVVADRPSASPDESRKLPVLSASSKPNKTRGSKQSQQAHVAKSVGANEHHKDLIVPMLKRDRLFQPTSAKFLSAVRKLYTRSSAVSAPGLCTGILADARCTIPLQAEIIMTQC